MLLGTPHSAVDLVERLRDRRAPSGEALPLGDRRAIDAQIATHGVIINTHTLELWVSASPNLLGRFVHFDLKRHLDAAYQPMSDHQPALDVAADPLLNSSEYVTFKSKHAPSP
jgi:hypothetical protein